MITVLFVGISDDEADRLEVALGASGVDIMQVRVAEVRIPDGVEQREAVAGPGSRGAVQSAGAGAGRTGGDEPGHDALQERLEVVAALALRGDQRGKVSVRLHLCWATDIRVIARADKGHDRSGKGPRLG